MLDTSKDTVIGTMTLTDTWKYVPSTASSAYREVEVPAGEYPVMKRWCTYSNRWVHGVKVTGTLVRDDWYGSNTRRSEPMTVGEWWVQYYDYELEKFASKGVPIKPSTGKPCMPATFVLVG